MNISPFCLHKQQLYFIDEKTEAEKLNNMPKACLVCKCWGQDLSSGSVILESRLNLDTLPL